MMIGTWTGKDENGNKYRVRRLGEDLYAVDTKGVNDEKWYGGLGGNAKWLELTVVDIEKAIDDRPKHWIEIDTPMRTIVSLLER